MANKGWKHKKTPIIIGNEKNPTKMESGQVIINKKATKKNLNKLININNDGLNNEKLKVSTDGTDGGILKGKPHYDNKGKSLGGIPVIVDGGKKIEVEGDEFVINKEASQKHWKELSKINQSAGNGVPINPSDVGSDEDPQEFRKGGTAKIIFNPNHIPNKWIYSYAKKIKENYPKVWDMGGNIFGNEAFKNLERVVKRGYWTDNEEWMYIKWQSFVARHHKDFRIAGTVAMLKWVDKTDKGWNYMKDLIDKEVAKKYAKKGFKRKLSDGGGVEFIPEKKGTLIRGNEIIKYFEKVNGNYRLMFYTLNETKGKVPTMCDAFGYCEELDIMNITPKQLVELIKKNNLMEYGGKVKDITCKSCNWSWNKSDSKKQDEYVCHKCGTDNKMKYGGELAKGIKVEAEHQNTFKKVYAHELNPMQAPIEVAKEHLKEDKNYYRKLSKMEKFDTGGAANTIEIGDIVRSEYFSGIYGNFRVVNPGADAIEVQNLLTGQKDIRQYFEVILFIKKGTNQVVIDNVPTTLKTNKTKVITQPAMPMPNVATVIKDELPKERKKFVSMDFQPFLQNWVSSNLTNSVNMDKKNIIEETVKDYIINVEAIDKNQNITFDKEAEILDKIDNYIN